MKLRKADLSDLESVARLFDLYRQFYECEPDFVSAKEFIKNRLENAESTIFVACDDDQLTGFTQLYPSFCSVEAIKILILYDLFVAPEYRKTGVGEALMNRATAYAKEVDASRLDLLTAKDNFPGQRLYEKLGYVRTNESFYAYTLYPQ